MSRFYQSPADLAERERRVAAMDKPASKKPAPVPTLLFSKADIDKAAGKARAEERERVRRVFASTASRGRERLAATLLSATDGWPAGDIIAKLPAVEGRLRAKGNAATDAIWDRANAKVESQRNDPAQAAGARDDSPWAKAYASQGAAK